MKKQLQWLTKPIAACFPKLAMTYRHLRSNWQTVKASWQVQAPPQDTPMGFKLSGNAVMQSGLFEPEETRHVKNILPHVDVVINVGANIGYYCCIALGMRKNVVAFEPVHDNLQHLLRNILANNWNSQIEIYPIALSDRIGAIEIYGGGTGASLVKGWAGAPEYSATLVPCSTLDNVLGSRFQKKKCFFIVDVEGAEYLMLAGAAATLKMDPKPIWMMEIAFSEHQPEGTRINPNLLSTFQVFWNCGYAAWTADKHCRLVNPDEIVKISNGGKDTLFPHNFLFVEMGKFASLNTTKIVLNEKVVSKESTCHEQ